MRNKFKSIFCLFLLSIIIICFGASLLDGHTSLSLVLILFGFVFVASLIWITAKAGES